MIPAEYSKFVKCIEENNLIGENDSVIAAVSGGADSLCLLILLMKYLPKERITAAHYNHCIRGAEADGDEAFVKAFCEKNGVDFVSEAGDIPSLAKEEGRGLEETARKYRYAFLNKIAAKKNALIAVAHNAQDLSETVFMHILRGSTVNGLKGISYKQGNIIRPCLDLTREETENVCKAEGVEPRYDSTNKDTSYTRNYVRLECFPALNQRFGFDINNSLIKLSKAARTDCDFIESAVAGVFDSVVFTEGNDILIRKKEFLPLHDAIAGRISLKCISSVLDNDNNPVYPFGIDVTENTISRLTEFVRAGKTGNRILLGRNVIAVSEYNNVRICFQEGKNDILPQYKLKISELSLEDARKLPDYPGGAGEKRAFFDKISLEKMQKCGTMVLRTGQEGDYLYLFGMNGRKKLRRVFTDAHISVLERDSVPVLAIGNEVLWVYGVKRSGRCKITDETNTVTVIELEEM